MTTDADRDRLPLPPFLLVARTIYFVDERRREGVLPGPGEHDAFEALAAEELLQRRPDGLFAPTAKGRIAYERTIVRPPNAFVLELVRRLAETFVHRWASFGDDPRTCDHPELAFARGNFEVRCVRCGRSWVARHTSRDEIATAGPYGTAAGLRRAAEGEA